MLKEKKFQITYFLFAIFALSTWLDLNGVWVELPLIVHSTPEGWALPSYLSLAVAISNIAPILIMLLKVIFKERLDERIFIYMEILIGIIACGLLAHYWNRTHWFAGSERSVLLIIFIFLLGTLDTTSTVTYADYMKRYHPKLLNALFLGESLTSLIPSIMAMIQGVGGEAICTGNSTQPEYSSPRYSVQIYFWLFATIIFMSLIAFLLLEWTHIANDYRTSNDRTSSVVQDQLSLQDETTSLKSMNRSMYYWLLIISYLINLVLFGILPSISTYAMLPYSQRAYYISSIVLPISNPLSIVVSVVFKTRLSITSILSVSLTASCLAAYVITIAVLSPCPPLHDTTSGAIIAMICYFLAQLLYYYIRIVIAYRIRTEWPATQGLFWLGAVSQLGVLSGSIPIYFLINTWNLFHGRNVCENYC